jgi:phosphoglycolate phosphatase
MTAKSNRTQPIKAVVFDLDGTLVDSAPGLLEAMNRLLAEESHPPISLPDITLMIGNGAAKTIERAFTKTGGAPADDVLEQLTARYLAYYEDTATNGSMLFPGVLATLEDLHGTGYSMGVCTNKPRAPTLKMLAYLEIAPYFWSVMGGDDLKGVMKPDPKHLLAVVQGLGRGIGEAVMIGDSANDVGAARCLGIPVIAVSFGYSKTAAIELGADLVIDRFDAIPEAIKSLS